MPADLTATVSWQSVGPLTEPTTFAAKGFGVQLTDTDPTTDLTQGMNMPVDRGHTYPAGKTIWYRSANGPVRVALQSAG